MVGFNSFEQECNERYCFTALSIVFQLSCTSERMVIKGFVQRLERNQTG